MIEKQNLPKSPIPSLVSSEKGENEMAAISALRLHTNSQS